MRGRGCHGCSDRMGWFAGSGGVGGGSKGKVERDGRVGGGVSGTDYPWKAINLPWDMDKRQRREERMHVRGHIRANTHVT